MSYRRAPYEFKVKAGVKYEFCTCGVSKVQPICDHSNHPGGLEPTVMVFENDEVVQICGCGKTKTSALCDGSHRLFP